MDTNCWVCEFTRLRTELVLQYHRCPADQTPWHVLGHRLVPWMDFHQCSHSGTSRWSASHLHNNAIISNIHAYLSKKLNKTRNTETWGSLKTFCVWQETIVVTKAHLSSIRYLPLYQDPQKSAQYSQALILTHQVKPWQTECCICTRHSAGICLSLLPLLHTANHYEDSLVNIFSSVNHINFASSAVALGTTTFQQLDMTASTLAYATIFSWILMQDFCELCNSDNQSTLISSETAICGKHMTAMTDSVPAVRMS